MIIIYNIIKLELARQIDHRQTRVTMSIHSIAGLFELGRQIPVNVSKGLNKKGLISAIDDLLKQRLFFNRDQNNEY